MNPKTFRNSIYLFILIACVGVWAGVFYFSYQSFRHDPENVSRSFDECVSKGGTVEGAQPVLCRFRGVEFVEDVGNSQEKRNLIRVALPIPNSPIQNPLKIRGEARGTWFFEASFPIAITLSDGTIVATGIAQATSDWMTEEFVPFEAEIQFSMPQFAERGLLKLMKDNPSGDSSHDDAVIIPIRFK